MHKPDRNAHFEKRDEFILVVVAMIIPVSTILSMI